ncbi:MAG: hypothetical protein AAGI01_17160, partial [Myxococcota bacterium]
MGVCIRYGQASDVRVERVRACDDGDGALGALAGASPSSRRRSMGAARRSAWERAGSSARGVGAEGAWAVAGG